ncbi:MAG: hypothetical protein GY928_03800 [Colwellia sp.]|nr:hypothetical protein [Colwellia sp.]
MKINTTKHNFTNVTRHCWSGHLNAEDKRAEGKYKVPKDKQDTESSFCQGCFDVMEFRKSDGATRVKAASSARIWPGLCLVLAPQNRKSLAANIPDDQMISNNFAEYQRYKRIVSSDSRIVLVFSKIPKTMCELCKEVQKHTNPMQFARIVASHGIAAADKKDKKKQLLCASVTKIKAVTAKWLKSKKKNFCNIYYPLTFSLAVTTHPFDVFVNRKSGFGNANALSYSAFTRLFSKVLAKLVTKKCNLPNQGIWCCCQVTGQEIKYIVLSLSKKELSFSPPMTVKETKKFLNLVTQGQWQKTLQQWKEYTIENADAKRLRFTKKGLQNYWSEILNGEARDGDESDSEQKSKSDSDFEMNNTNSKKSESESESESADKDGKKSADKDGNDNDISDEDDNSGGKEKQNESNNESNNGNDNGNDKSGDKGNDNSGDKGNGNGNDNGDDKGKKSSLP